MTVIATIIDGHVTREAEAAALARVGGSPGTGPDGIGAALRFEGVVRPFEDGRALLALDYQTYDPMAQQELESLARGVATRHRLTSLTALHSRGRVGVGQVSFVLAVGAPHGAEAIAAVKEFIDRLKRDVPIWKMPVWTP